jgi:hypothetical protein
MSNVIAELERRLEEAEDENDALELRLARIEDALLDREPVPAAVVNRLGGARTRSGFGASIVDRPCASWRDGRE